MKKLLQDSGRMYVLRHGVQSDTLVLTAVCGGIAMSEVHLELNEQERQAYEDEGKPALDRMALRICQWPDRYQGRLRTQFSPDW